MKTRVKKDSDGLWVLLPRDVAGAYADCDAEITGLKNGIFTCMALPKVAAQKGGDGRISDLVLSDDEHNVARKLFSIRYENRIVPLVEKSLSQNEKKALARLLARKLIMVFTGRKYAKGVYNISELLYVHLRQEVPMPSAQAAPPSPPQQIIRAMPNTLEHLAAAGYMVLDNESDAKSLMPHMQEQIKAGAIRGVRGFDKKYYVLTKGFRMANEGKLLAQLDRGESSIDKLADGLSLRQDAVRTLLLVLAEEGEVLEKNMRKGVWTRA